MAKCASLKNTIPENMSQEYSRTATCSSPTVLGETTHATQGLPKRSVFSGRLLLSGGVFPGLFLGDGVVIALLGCFRSLCIPLGTSVENGVSGNRGLGFRNRADNGRFMAIL